MTDVRCPHGVELDDEETADQAVMTFYGAFAPRAWWTRWCTHCREARP